MNLNGVYLYGFVPDRGGLDLAGIEGIEEGGPVLTLNLGGARAVVGSVSIEAFEAGLASGVDGGPDPSWLIPRALRHEATLDAVLARSPVLPARFGTLFSSDEALGAMASAHQREIARFFEDLGDRLEWSLRGYHDPVGAVGLLLESDPDLSSRYQALPASPGTRYFLEKKLREEARRRASSGAALAAEAARRTLRTLTDDVRSLPTRGVEAPGREMVLHETFLLEPWRACEVLEHLESAVSPGIPGVPGLLTWEPSGPWPPFHFCPELGVNPS